MPTLWFNDARDGRKAVVVEMAPYWIHPGVGLAPAPAVGGGIWALVAAPGTRVRVNGLPLPGGLRVLDDRDEIRVGANAPLWFTELHPARVTGLPGAVTTPCARCLTSIEPGSPAVSCPRCGLWYHGTSERPCWSYAPQCGGCGHATCGGAESVWSPEGL